MTKKNSLAVLPQYSEYDRNLANAMMMQHNSSTSALIKNSPPTANKHREGSQRDHSDSSSRDNIKISKDNRNIVSDMIF